MPEHITNLPIVLYRWGKTVQILFCIFPHPNQIHFCLCHFQNNTQHASESFVDVSVTYIKRSTKDLISTVPFQTTAMPATIETRVLVYVAVCSNFLQMAMLRIGCEFWILWKCWVVVYYGLFRYDFFCQFMWTKWKEAGGLCVWHVPWCFLSIGLTFWTIKKTCFGTVRLPLANTVLCILLHLLLPLV